MFRHLCRLTCLAVVALALLAAGLIPAVRAQEDPDAWTAYILNLRAGPGVTFDVIAELAYDAPLVVEAHDDGLNWLLVHAPGGAPRGWVVAGYLRYREGFSASRLPVSTEMVAAGAPAPVSADAAAPDDPPPDDAASPPTEEGPPPPGIVEQTLIYESNSARYYRMVYLSEGYRVTGFLGIPKLDERMPAIIYNRGGMWDSGGLIGLEIVPLVEAGYVAAASNYRGNMGSEGWESFGEGDMLDVLNLITVLQGLPNVDPWRIGMMGGSRGGLVTYMVLKAEAATGRNRVRAAVSIGGIADLFMWAEEHPDMTGEIYPVLIGGTLENNTASYASRSATHWPELFVVPLLLMHGGADDTVSPDQSRVLYSKIKGVGGDVTLLEYPGDDHPLTGQLGGYPEALRYFNRYFANGASRLYEPHIDDIRSVSAWFYANQP
jgi:acetyl esterase/lipase